MRNKAAYICMFLGAVLIIGALSLFLHNQKESNAAEEMISQILPEIIEQINENRQEASKDGNPIPDKTDIPVEFLEPEDLEMTEVVIDGHAYIGHLTIPKLELDLPVMSGWDYSKLRIAPCRYRGSVNGRDLVIMAHNYPKHFLRIDELNEGDKLTFCDMDGVVTRYLVVGKDVLDPSKVEDVISGEYDLTLFTCTYSGQQRITVYCDRIKN